jgi:replicative DNA helicase
MNNLFYDVGIERGVLATLLNQPEYLEDIELSSDDFSSSFHVAFFEILLQFSNRNLIISEEGVKNALGNKFRESDFFAILVEAPLTNFDGAVLTLKDKSIRRKTALSSDELKKIASNPDIGTDEILSEFDRVKNEIEAEIPTDGVISLPQANKTALDRLRELQSREGTEKYLTGLSTGYIPLDKLTTGFNKGKLIVIGARPSVGKTALALNFVINALEKGVGVFFLSLEMPEEELMFRAYSIISAMPLQKIVTGDLTLSELKILEGVANKMEERGNFYIDLEARSFSRFASALRKVKKKDPSLGLVVVDYVQIMAQGTGTGRLDIEIGNISRGLKKLALELELPIIALSQLSRGVESRADKRPILSDLRESGAIESDADIIFFLYRDDIYRAREEKQKEADAKAKGKTYISNIIEKREEVAEIIVGKHRNGALGTIKLLFQKQFTRFVPYVENMGNELPAKETKVYGVPDGDGWTPDNVDMPNLGDI